MASRFDLITAHLQSSAEESVSLTFAQIEGLIGRLCPSAITWDAYWREAKSHTITHAWLRAGYVFARVSRAARVLELKRDPARATALLQEYRVRTSYGEASLHVREADGHGASSSVWPGLIALVVGEVGAVMVAFALLHVTYDRYTRDAWSAKVERVIRDQATFSHVGMKCAAPRLSNTEVGDLIRNARHLRVLKTWFPEADDMLAAFKVAVGHAESIEILLCQPESPILTARSEGAGHGRGDGAACVRRTLRTIGEACDACSRDPFQRLRLGLYDAWPGCPIICADGKILLGFYFRQHASPATPWIEVWPGSELSALIDEQFSSLWHHPKTTRITSCAALSPWAAT